jgi:hypothetical protein
MTTATAGAGSIPAAGRRQLHRCRFPRPQGIAFAPDTVSRIVRQYFRQGAAE